jgi:hypothetical protein
MMKSFQKQPQIKSLPGFSINGKFRLREVGFTDTVLEANSVKEKSAIPWKPVGRLSHPYPVAKAEGSTRQKAGLLLYSEKTISEIDGKFGETVARNRGRLF